MKKAKYDTPFGYLSDRIEIIREILMEKGIITTKEWNKAREKVWKKTKRVVKDV